MSQIFKNGLRIMLWNIRKELLSVFWFLNIIQAAGHNIAATISNFLLEVLRVGNTNSKKCMIQAQNVDFLRIKRLRKIMHFLE